MRIIKSVAYLIFTLMSVFALANISLATPITIVNPSFEQQVGLNLSDGAWEPASGGQIFGWNATGRAGTYNPTTSEFAVEAPDGDDIAFINSGWIGQWLGTNVIDNAIYTLQTDVGARVSGSLVYTAEIVARALGQPTTVLATLSGAPLVGTWQTIDVIYDVSSNPSYVGWELGVRFYGSGVQVNLDNVRLENSSPVPEPTTVILLGIGLTGFIGFSGFRRKFKK
jgi:hypothetical protein